MLDRTPIVFASRPIQCRRVACLVALKKKQRLAERLTRRSNVSGFLVWEFLKSGGRFHANPISGPFDSSLFGVISRKKP